MKAFTVSLKHVINACSPVPEQSSMVSPGIMVIPGEKTARIHLGQYGPDCCRDFVAIAYIGGAEESNNTVHEAEIGWSESKFRSPFLVKPKHKSSDLLVLVKTETERCAGLRFSGMTDGTEGGIEVISSGVGCDRIHNFWDHVLVVIKPYCAIIIEAKDGSPAIAIANSGGNIEGDSSLHPKPVVMNYEDYVAFEQHILAKPAHKPETMVVSQSITTTATGTTKAHKVTEERKHVGHGGATLDMGTVKGKLGESGIKFVRSERPPHRKGLRKDLRPRPSSLPAVNLRPSDARPVSPAPKPTAEISAMA